MGIFYKIADKFGKLKLTNQLLCLVGSLSAGIMISVYVNDQNHDDLLVGGPNYTEIIMHKDLIADILPPPSYLIEAWQVCLEMKASKTSSKEELLEKSKTLAKDFSDRHEYWIKNIEKEHLLYKQMNSVVFETGQNFLKVRDDVFIPAFQAGNTAVMDTALAQLKDLYNTHRKAVDEVVKTSTKETQAIELVTEKAKVSVDNQVFIMNALLIAYIGIMCSMILVSIKKKLGGEAEYVRELAKNISEGNFENAIVKSTDSKGSVITSMSTLQDKLRELIQSLNKTCDEQSHGNYDAKLDTSFLTGSYQTLGLKVNEMITLNAEEMRSVMLCAQGFGNGDFDAPIPSFPGKKAAYNRNIEQIRSNLQAISADASMLTEAATSGDINKRADATQHQGDFRKIIEGVNQTLDIILNPIHSANQAANALKTISSEISASNSTLAKRTEQQALSLEETAATTEQLAVTVKQNADNALTANKLAQTATEVAIKGSRDVENVVKTMNDINYSASKISDIISVIDGIAFQTNILALNAAVEAARAGEQGRGFAVVAGEVRSLAQRSSNAAKEIKELINTSVRTTHEGTVHVEHAGRTMEAVVESIKTVGKLVNEIADASREQSTGLEQINVAISKLDDTTQQNVVMVQQAAVCAEQLSDQANNLMNSMKLFSQSTVAQPLSPTLPSKKIKTSKKAASSQSVQFTQRAQSNSEKDLVTTEEDNWDSF